MARSVTKPPYMHHSVLKKLQRNRRSERKSIIKTYSRSTMVIPDMVGEAIHVYNGRTFIPVEIREEMVGHKLGEFAPTRTFRGHAGDKSAKKR